MKSMQADNLSPSNGQFHLQSRSLRPTGQPGRKLSGNSSGREACANPQCIVCGAENPNGLQLDFVVGVAGAEATWVPADGWESFRGTVHGGIVTAVLDESMSRAIVARGWQALTVDLRVRFHGRVRPGETLRVQGWVVERRRRRILAEAKLFTEGGVERAHGWGVFLTPPSVVIPGKAE